MLVYILFCRSHGSGNIMLLVILNQTTSTDTSAEMNAGLTKHLAWKTGTRRSHQRSAFIRSMMSFDCVWLCCLPFFIHTDRIVHYFPVLLWVCCAFCWLAAISMNDLIAGCVKMYFEVFILLVLGCVHRHHLISVLAVRVKGNYKAGASVYCKSLVGIEWRLGLLDCLLSLVAFLFCFRLR